MLGDEAMERVASKRELEEAEVVEEERKTAAQPTTEEEPDGSA
jgi:hypothetical protein